jgi:hypothetical protein
LAGEGRECAMTTATAVGYVEMPIAKVVGLGAAEDEPFHYIVVEELSGDRQLVDARPSDALNLAALVQAPIFAAPEVLQEAEARRAGDFPEAARLRRALVAAPMTVGTVGMPGGDVGATPP